MRVKVEARVVGMGAVVMVRVAVWVVARRPSGSGRHGAACHLFMLPRCEGG